MRDIYLLMQKAYLIEAKGISATLRKLVDERIINNIEYREIHKTLIGQNLEEIKTIDKYILYKLFMLLKELDIAMFRNLKETDFFTQNELSEYLVRQPKIQKEAFPIIINNAIKLSDKDEFSVVLKIQDIYRLESKGAIKIISGMQRQDEYTEFGEKIVTHVAYNDDVAQEIAKHIEQGTYRPSTLRWHIVNEGAVVPDYFYDEKELKLTINQAIIAEIDGQHRSSAISYAIVNNPSINLKFNIIITTGTTSDAQYIINQDEKRQPIDIDKLKVYEQTIYRDMLLKIKQRLSNTSWKFYVTKSEFEKRIGFLNEPEIMDTLEKLIVLEKNQGRLSTKTDNEIVIDTVIAVTNILNTIELYAEKYHKIFQTEEEIPSTAPIYLKNREGTTVITTLAYILGTQLSIEQINELQYKKDVIEFILTTIRYVRPKDYNFKSLVGYEPFIEEIKRRI